MGERNKKLLIGLIVLAVVIIGVVVVSSMINTESEVIKNEVKTIPLSIEDIVNNFSVEENMLTWEYENKTNKTISRCEIDILIKSTEKEMVLQSTEVVEPDKISKKVQQEIEVVNADDLEVTKYKIVLQDGTYLEYDVIDKTYNWS